MKYLPVITPGACAAMTACGSAPKGCASVSAGDTRPGLASVPRTAAPATASCEERGVLHHSHSQIVIT